MRPWRFMVLLVVVSFPWTMAAQEIEEAVGKALAAADKTTAADLAAWCDRLVEPEKRPGADDTGARIVLHGLAMRAGTVPALRANLLTAFGQVLGADRPKSIKAFVLEQLQYVATAETVPAVAPWLGDPELCDPACRVLVSTRSPAAAVALRAALAAANDRPRLSLVQALAALEPTEPLPELYADAAATDRELRLAALTALAVTADPKAGQLLLEATRDASAYVRAWAGQAYADFLRRLVKAGRTDEAVRLALAFGQEHASEGHIQSAVLEVCGLAGTPPAVDAILSGLQSDSDRIRHSAARALQRLPSETAAARLAQAVEAAPVPKRPVLLTLLGDLGSPVALPVIRNQTAADDPAVRAAAVRALGNIRGAETLPQLLTFLDDAREGVAAAAAEALATRRDDTVGAALAQAAAGAPPAPRAAMIKVLARRLDVGQVDTVLRSATDADAGVRLAAMKALEVLAAPEQAGPMVELLSHCPEGDELKAGVAALTALCRRAPKPEPIRALLLEGLAKADAPHKAALLQVTPAVAAAPALETVTRELSNPDAAVRTAAVRALSEWPDPAALPALKDLTTKATDEVAYVLAFRGYVRLLQVGDQPAAARVALYDEALTLARRVDERRLVLAALGALKDRAAFPKLLPPLQDPGLQAEAAAGILRLAQDVRDDDAVRALREVLKVSKDEAFVKRVRELLAELTKNAGCVVTWDVSGPYTEGNKGLTELHEVAFPPETDPATAQWQTAKAEADGRLDLVKLLGGSNRCAYMRCQVVVDAAMDASLTVGSDDGVKAWLNGKVVLDKNVPRPFKWGEDTVPVSLVQGANLLLLKVTQGGGDWMANARVAGADGIAVDGLRFETVAPAAPTPPATP